jgi:hypothetical protein
MPRPERYFIGPNTRDKLRDLMTRADGTPAPTPAVSIPTRLQDVQRPGGGGSGGVEAYFTGAWVKGQQKQITFLGSTSSTALAVNLLRTVPLVSTGATARYCIITKRSVSTTASQATYTLLNTEC